MRKDLDCEKVISVVTVVTAGCVSKNVPLRIPGQGRLLE